MLTQKQEDAMIVVPAKISAILQREPFMLYNNVDHRIPDPVKKLRIVCPQNFDFFRYRRRLQLQRNNYLQRTTPNKNQYLPRNVVITTTAPQV